MSLSGLSLKAAIRNSHEIAVAKGCSLESSVINWRPKPAVTFNELLAQKYLDVRPSSSVDWVRREGQSIENVAHTFHCNRSFLIVDKTTTTQPIQACVDTWHWKTPVIGQES